MHGLSKRHRTVRRALDVVKLDSERCQTSASLSATLGVSRRTLERAFREVLGLSPYQYMLRSRLLAARSDLRNGASHVTVTEVAHRYEFCTSSEFASHYKRVFGEPPSATLRAQRS